MISAEGIRKIRIAFVLNVGYSLFREEVQETYGGGQIDLYLLAQELKNIGRYDVSMLFLDYGQPPQETVDGIRLYKTYRPRRSGGLVLQFFAAFWRLWLALRRANADIYFHESAEFEISVTRIFCFFYKKKFVYRCANIIDVDGRYHREHPWHGRLFSFGLAGANAIIAQTKDQALLLEQKGFMVTIIGNMFPFHPRSPSNKTNIIWVGRMTKIKHPEIFLRLAENFPKQHFLLLGPIDSIDQDFARSIQKQAKTLLNVNYIDKIPFRKTPEIFDQAKILVNTSEYEGFPVTFVQAMCHGVPVLTMGIDPDQVVSKVCGLVAKDEQELCQKLMLLLEPKTWATYSQASLKHAADHFSPAVIIPKYERVFYNIISP